MIFNLITKAKNLFYSNKVSGLSANNTQDAIDELANITFKPWDSSKTYLIGEYCVYNGKLYRCLRDNTGQTPAEGTYWTSVKVADEVNTLNQSLATKVNTSALGTAAYKAYTTSVTSGSANLVTSGAVYTRLNTQLDGVKIAKGIDTQLQKASATGTEYTYTINLSSYSFSEVPTVILTLRRAGYTGTADYQISDVSKTTLKYMIKFSNLGNISGCTMHWVAIGKY